MLTGHSFRELDILYREFYELQSQVTIKDEKINQLMQRLNMPSKTIDM